MDKTKLYLLKSTAYLLSSKIYKCLYSDKISYGVKKLILKKIEK